MKRYIILIISLLLFSCNYHHKFSCDEIEKEVFADTICYIDILRIDIADDQDKYFIFKKYGVMLTSFYGTKGDSCYYEACKKKIMQNTSINFDSINNDIMILHKDTSHAALFSKTYYDGVYSSLLDLNPYIDDGKRANPQIGFKDYYSILFTKLMKILPLKKGKEFDFWVTIDTLGSVEKVEIVNKNCNKVLIDSFTKEYSKIKWIPAEYEGHKVKYRFLEYLIY